MIVIGVDVHKHSLTAVAVDGLGRTLAERTGPVGEEVLAWARSLGEARLLWALEDCRHLSRGLERLLLEAGGRLVRVPPRLTGPQRRRGRSRGKSDSLDALAVARAALRQPRLDRPRPQEPLLRELKLLVDHRDDLVAERRRCRQRLRWHLHELDPSLAVPLGALDRGVWLERLRRRLARREQTTQVRIAPELVGRCRQLTHAIAGLERELQERTRTTAPRPLELGVAPLEASSGKQRRHRLDRGGNRQLNCALHRIAVTQGRTYAPARAYLERKQSEGKSRREALRCLKRQLARAVYTTLKTESALT
jgi:transposase